jgi:hypothetical protein
MFPGKLDFRFDALAGYGLGHFAAAGFPDAIVTSNGSTEAIPFVGGMANRIYHPTKTNDVYAYYFYSQVDRTKIGFGQYAAGSVALTASCMVENSPLGCDAIAHSAWDISIGDWQRIYSGDAGTFTVDIMNVFYRVNAFKNSSGGVSAMPHAVDDKVEVALRYTPF